MVQAYAQAERVLSLSSNELSSRSSELFLNSGDFDFVSAGFDLDTPAWQQENALV